MKFKFLQIEASVFPEKSAHDFQEKRGKEDD